MAYLSGRIESGTQESREGRRGRRGEDGVASDTNSDFSQFRRHPPFAVKGLVEGMTTFLTFLISKLKHAQISEGGENYGF